MKYVLMSGGKGKRLWPLSTDEKPKQFIKVFGRACMLENTYNKLVKNFKKKDVYIATSSEYIDLTKETLPNFKNIIIEKEAIGTVGAILNVAIYIKKVKDASDDEIVSILPIDHDIDDSFYTVLTEAEDYIKNSDINLCLIGVKPTRPATQYGYIIEENGIINEFKEKPNEELAKEYIKKGALWNSGVVVFKLKEILDIASNYLSYESYDEFALKYNTLPHISFDYEVLEKSDNVGIVVYDGHFEDIGTWENIANKLSESDEYNTNIINSEEKTIINDGVKNIIVINTKDGIRIIPKN